MEQPIITQGPDGEAHQGRATDRRQQDYARMQRYRQIASALREAAVEIEGRVGAVVLSQASDVLLQRCAEIARRYQ